MPMDWNPLEARTAAHFATLDLDFEGTLTHGSGGSVATYRLMFDGHPYALPGGKRFPTVAALESAFEQHMPTFRLHALCCHQLMLRHVEDPTARAAIDQWLDAEALAPFKPEGAGFPWTSAEQKAGRGGPGYLRTFGPPWTGIDVDRALPAWALEDDVCARFDPARPRVYLDALRRLLLQGEQLWLAEHMPTGSTPVLRRRL